MKKRSVIRLVLLAALLCSCLLSAAYGEAVMLDGLHLPGALLVIEESAFEGASSVSQAAVPEGVKRIERRAFACSSLKWIELPQSLEYIADDAFEGCTIWMAYVPSGSYAQEWCVANDISHELLLDSAVPFSSLTSPLIRDIALQDDYTAARITWDPVQRAQGYRLYRACSGLPEEAEWIKTVTQACSVLDDGLATGETYVYMVQAFAYNENGELILSEMSLPYSVYAGETVDTPAIADICTVDVSGLSLSWQAVRNGAWYDVYRSETGAEGSFEKIISTAALTYEDMGLLSGTDYWYCIQARSESGVLSEMSAVRMATTDQTIYRALLIGNTYPGTSDALPGPDNDIAAVEAMLQLQTATPYAVTSQLNVTTDEMAAAIPKAFQGADSTDVSVFYYSGHGTQNGNLCGTEDTRMSSQQLRACLDEIPGTKVVLLDCCYSGYHINKSAEDTQSLEKAFNESVVTAFAAKTRSYLAADEYIVLTACSMRQTSVSSVIYQNGKLFYFGAYTYALAKGSGYHMHTQQATSLWADEAGNGDGSVSLAEAYDYVVDTVETELKYSQDAQYYGDGEFVLWSQR